MADKEQIIISTSGALAKLSGGATAVTATGGVWAFLIDHQQPILIACALVGAAVTIFTAWVNTRYQRKRDARENERNERERSAETRRQLVHDKEMAIKEFQLNEMKKSAQKTRRSDDDQTTETAESNS